MASGFSIHCSRYSELPEERRVQIDEAAWAEFEQYDIVRATQWATADWTFLAFEDEELVAYYNLVDRSVVMDGDTVDVAGLNNMVTLPKHRGRGYASRLLRETQPVWCQQLGVDCGLLLCADALVAFYSRLGWVKVDSPVWYAQPTGARQWVANCMLLPGVVSKLPSVKLDLNGLPW